MLNKQYSPQTNQDCEHVQIKDAVTEQERQAIYQFRYTVQVEEMKRCIPGADHVKKCISEEMDSWSHLAYAELNGQIVGTARAVIGSAKDFPADLVQIFQLKRYQEFDPTRKTICFATKLMVDPRLRKTPLSFRLMAKVYELSRQHNVQFSFSGSNPYLIPMYEQLGYRQIAPGFQDPGYGFIVPTLLLTEDIDHLKAVKSPYLRLARKLTNSPAAKQWLASNLPEAFRYPVGILTSRQDHWNTIKQLVGDPVANLKVLRDLTDEEAGQLLKIGTLIECSREHYFIRRGDVCNEVNILLAGQMNALDGQALPIKPGDICGDIGILDQTHHHNDVIAAEHSVILVLSRTPFEKLCRSFPEIPGKLHFINQNREVK